MTADCGILWRVVLLLHLADAQAKSRPPHIVLVVADDLGTPRSGGLRTCTTWRAYGATSLPRGHILRYDLELNEPTLRPSSYHGGSLVVSCWNDVSWHNEKMHTPNLEKLAQEGVILGQHYVLPTCTPTRAALLTGRYPYKLGIQGHGIRPLEPYGLPLGMRTLAEELANRDYSTHAFGKWHLGYCDWKMTPTRRGFSTFRGYYLGSQDHFSHMKSPRKTKSDADGYDYRNYESVDYLANGTYSTTLIENHVLETIDEKSKQSGPVFLYVAFQAVHAPLQAQSGYGRVCSSHKSPRRVKLCEMAAAMDAAVGRIVQKLKEVRMWDNCLFVFMSDNGGQVLYGGNNWPLRGNKNTVFEGGTRVPAFVAGPLLKRPGYTRSSPMHVVDWFPTFLSATGVENSLDDIDGVDHWPAIRDGTADAPRNEFVYNLDSKGNKLFGAIRQGDLKLIMRPSKAFDKQYAESEEPSESTQTVDNSQISVLYNITADPYEEEDLFSKLKTEANRLGSKLRAQRSLMIPSPSLEDNTEGDPSRQEPEGVFSPGWCTAPVWQRPDGGPEMSDDADTAYE